MEPLVSRAWRFARAGVAGGVATLVDLGVLALLVSVFHLDPRVASSPALLAGGVTNFFANRHFAFRAQQGSLARQVALFSVVEVGTLVLNGVLYDTALRSIPGAAGAYWAVRLATSHVVFLLWSYPLWNKVFRPVRAVRFAP
jgi:putative flippase GtrA